MLRYWHGPPAPLHLVVQGPGPSCRVVGRIPTIGRPGLNSVAVPRRLVGSGTYLVTARSSVSGTGLARVLLTIRSPGGASGRVTRPRCDAEPTATIREVAFEVAVAPTRLTRQGARTRDSSPEAPQVSGVLGAAFPSLDPPPPAAEEAFRQPSALAVALILVAMLSVGGMFLVVRRGRRPQPFEVLPHGYRPPGRWVETAFETADRSEAKTTSLVEGRATVVKRAARPARGEDQRS